MEFRCTVCYDTFASQDALCRHRSNKHAQNFVVTANNVQYPISIQGGRYSCPVEGCGRTYEGRDALRKHVKDRHNEHRGGCTTAPADNIGGPCTQVIQGTLATKLNKLPTSNGTGLQRSGAGENRASGVSYLLEKAQAPLAKSDLERGELLDGLGMWLHSALQILVCRQCEVGLTTETMLGHMKNQHNVSVTPAQKSALEQLCQDRMIHKKPGDVTIPKAGGPPVQGIAAPVEGFACCADSACTYCVRDQQTMIRHSKEKHGQPITSQRVHRSCMVQCLFQGIGKIYFEVDPTATTGCDLDVRRYLRGTFLPAHAQDLVAPQELDRDRPPLLRITLWDEFQPEIRSDDGQRSAAWRLKATHKADEGGGIFAALKRAVERYHAAVRVLLDENHNSFTIAKVLLNGRGYKPEQTDHFRFVSKENDAYDSLYLQMIRAMIRSSLGHEFKMEFKYTLAQEISLDDLICFLKEDAMGPTESTQTNALQAYHHFCWTLVNDGDAQHQTKWDNPIERFLWVKALCADGSFLPAQDVTPILARLKYFCRIVTLYEGLAGQDRNIPQDVMTRIGNCYDIVLQLGKPSTFNSLFELQQFVSSLAYSQVSEPQVYMDPTHKWISIGGQTLHLQSLRDGMQKILQTAKDIYLCLSGDSDWAGLPIGLKVVDDLSNTHRGYSFLEEQPFRNKKHTFFLSLVARRRLGAILADGTWAWDHVAIKEFLNSADRLWGYVIHALYVGVHLSTRATQFLQHQIRNADRPRNIFFQGEEGFILMRYSKTTHLKSRDSCIPAFLSKPLKEVLLVLLGDGLREAQAILAGIAYGEEARGLYRTYLCVANGQRITPEEFCRDLPKRNYEAFGCQWGAREFRQGMITLAHQFIPPNESFAFADELLAEAADHSAEVDVGHYAIVHGTVPRVTVNQMNNQRWLAEEWGSLLGFGPFSPPEPVAVMRRQSRSTNKTLEANELAAQVATLVVDAVMDRLNTLGLTQDTIHMLSRAASRQLILPGPAPSELNEPPPATPSPPHIHIGSFSNSDQAKIFPKKDGGVPSSPPSLSPDKLKGKDVSTVNFDEESPASNLLYRYETQTTGQRRRAIIESDQIAESPHPSKRPRIYRATTDTQVVSEADVELGGCRRRDLIAGVQVRSSRTPGQSCPVGEEFLSLINVNNPSMVNEDDLQENIRHTLRELVSDPYAWEKSRAQMLAIMVVMRREQDAVITIRTGGGKSMLWMIPPLLDNSIRPIVVSPYSILLDEQYQNAVNAGLRAVNFKLDKCPPKDTQILFVQVEHVSRRSPFEKLLLDGDAVNFTHMIIDEQHDHITCPEDRRDAWCQLTQFASRANMPIILLSGTTPPSLQRQILANFGLREESTALIRSPTNRPELGLHVIPLHPFAASAALACLVSALSGKLKVNERMLVFFESCELAESFAREHSFAVYHSKLRSSDMKHRNLHLWDSGTTRVMACTSAFGFGVDRPNVRFVVIFSPRRSLLTTMQMAGRAGRDGKEAHVFLATSEQPPSFREKTDFFAWELEQLIAQPVCRVYQAMYSMDGPDIARKCTELPRQVPCDVCKPDSEMHVFATRAVQDPMQRFAKPAQRDYGGDGFSLGTTHGSFEQMAPRSEAQVVSNAMGVTLSFEDKRSIWPGPKLASQPNRATTSQPDKRLTSAASMPDLHFSSRSEDSNNARKGRLNRTAELDRYMPLLQGKCPYHFIFEGKLEVDHFPECELEARLPSNSPEGFHAFKESFLFKKYTFCYTCGMPQDKKMNGEGPRCHAAHKWTERKPCKFGSFIFRATFCIWQDEDLRREMIKGLGVTEAIAEQEQFTEWAKRELPAEGKYNNCLEVFLWFCRRKEHTNPKYFLR